MLVALQTALIKGEKSMSCVCVCVCVCVRVCPVQWGLVCIVGLELTEAADQLRQLDPPRVYAFKVDGECGAAGWLSGSSI